jgi:hypothetical protein
MVSDELDDYLERARLASASTVVPDGFTDRVLRAVRLPHRAPERFDFLTTVVPSGTLVGTGAVLWLSGDVVLSFAAVALLFSGFLWMWLDDPFGAAMTIRLSPW